MILSYFSIGAHPGFALAPGESLSDYYIEFEETETLDRHLLEEACLTEKQKELSLPHAQWILMTT